VSETSPSIQAKVLRVLQDGMVRPVGSDGVRPTDVRVIAATNIDLRESVSSRRFRPDLFYRLQVFPIHLPPLRERREDIRLLAAHSLRLFCEQEAKDVPGFEPETLRRIERYSWPGNVRELQNEIHRLVLCGEPGQMLDSDLLAPWIGDGACGIERQPLKDIVRQVELATIRTRLREHGYQRSATARSLGITRETLWTKLRQLGVTAARRVNGEKG
jgi:two-component system, NtrC family, response regulator HupR/HoxA